MTNLISDLYKDAYGFRPSSEWLKNYAALSPDEQEKIDADLDSAVEISIQIDKDTEEMNYSIWFNSIGQIASANNVTIGTAIRWDMEAYDATMGGEPNVGFYCYLTGIGYKNEAFIKKELALG